MAGDVRQSKGLRNRLAFLCLVIPALAEVGLGVVYLTASKVMPYHEQAMGVSWSQLTPGERALLVTFVRGYGSTHLAVGISMLVLLWMLFRHGHRWARWALLAVGLPVLGATAYLSARLAAATNADTPWPGACVLLFLFVAGLALAVPAAGRRQ